MVCHGTNFQQVRRLEQPATEAALAVDAPGRIPQAPKAIFHKGREFREGQWAYVWRRVGNLGGAPTKLARS
eukprot:4402674-Alexandrium_andersonii.AAC.1